MRHGKLFASVHCDYDFFFASIEEISRVIPEIGGKICIFNCRDDENLEKIG